MTRSSEARPHDSTGVGQAGSVECGALVRVEVTIDDGLVSSAQHKVYGCPATVGCAQELIERVRGLSLLEAASVSEVELMEAVPVAADRVDSACLAVDALHAALTKALATNACLHPAGDAIDPRGVLVGMSGGVDSAVAALLLREQGYRVVGVTLELWSEAGTPGERSCCSPETVRRARRVAHSLGIPHMTLDLRDLFYDQVVTYFIESYRGGATPNPCAKCNALVRFQAMVGLSDRLGMRWVATGHYARMIGEPSGLARGIDRSKDQSYVLAEVDPALLRRVLFPLGEMRKAEVRVVAAEAGLEGHGAPESQEICFIPNDDHRRFLRERFGDLAGADLAGEIVDSTGRPVGHHAGVYNFTIGQRRGLGLSHPEPRFVIRLDAEVRHVVVGAESELRTCALAVEGLTRHRPLLPGDLTVQVRSSGEAMPVLVRDSVCVDRERDGETVRHAGVLADRVTVVFDHPATAVAPGQTAVVYENDAVVLAGSISSTEPCVTDSALPEAAGRPMV